MSDNPTLKILSDVGRALPCAAGEASPAGPHAALGEHVGPHPTNGIAALTAAAARLERLQHANAMEAARQASAANLEHQAAAVSSPSRHPASPLLLTSEYSAGSSPERSPSPATSESRQATAASSTASRSATASPSLAADELDAGSHLHHSASPPLVSDEPRPFSLSPCSASGTGPLVARGPTASSHITPAALPPMDPREAHTASIPPRTPSPPLLAHEASPASLPCHPAASQPLATRKEAQKAPVSWQLQAPVSPAMLRPAVGPTPGHRQAGSQLAMHKHGKPPVMPQTSLAAAAKGPHGCMKTNPAAAPYPGELPQVHVEVHGRVNGKSKLNAAEREAAGKPSASRQLGERFDASAATGAQRNDPESLQQQAPRQLPLQPQASAGPRAPDARVPTSSSFMDGGGTIAPEQQAMAHQSFGGHWQSAQQINNSLFEPEEPAGSFDSGGAHWPAAAVRGPARDQLLIKHLVSSAAEQSDNDSDAGHEQVDFMMTAMEAQMEQQMENQLDLCVISHDPMPMPDDMQPRMTGLPDTPTGPSGRGACDTWGHACSDSSGQQAAHQQQLPQQPSHPRSGASSAQRMAQTTEPGIGAEQAAEVRARKFAQSVGEPERPVTPTWRQPRHGYGLTTILEDSSDTGDSDQPLDSDSYPTLEVESS